MENNKPGWNPFTQWDPWPLTRLLLVLASLSLLAHLRYDCALPTLAALGRGVFGLFEVFCVFAFFGLAQLYLALLLFPLYAAIVLNDWFYESCYWALGLAGPRSPRWKAGFALVGELGLFIGLGQTMDVLLRYWL